MTVEIDLFKSCFAYQDVARQHREKLTKMLFALRGSVQYLPP